VGDTQFGYGVSRGTSLNPQLGAMGFTPAQIQIRFYNDERQWCRKVGFDMRRIPRRYQKSADKELDGSSLANAM